MRWLFLALAIAGCAQAGQAERGQDVDAAVRQDGSFTFIDSSTGIDSSTCTMVTQNLLTNGNLDAGATGWTVTPIVIGDPIIATNADGGLAAQSPTYRAWMGGYEEAPAANKDSMYQDVAIPASATMLAFTGYYDVRSEEPNATAYDKAVVEIASTAGAQIELIKALDDNGETTAWTPFNKTIAANVAGQTIRLRLSSAGDGLYATSFFFDTLELSATYCQ